MLSKTIALTLFAVLFGASASTSASARTATITSIGHSLAVCDDGSSPAPGCGGQRCVSVERWAGARTAGPTFPMPCRPIASLASHPIA